MRILMPLLALGLACPFSLNAAGLNDTGIGFGGSYPSGNNADCSGDVVAQQDCSHGRDVTNNDPSDGGKGFSFTKIANDGSALPASATLGTNPADWACTYDNTTGLMWEVKTTSGLRSQSHSYTWYDSVHNYGGNPGTASGGTCATAGRCDTEKFVEDVNAQTLCNHADWRMPTKEELSGIADLGRFNPAIDPDYFPNTPASDFWSGSPVAGNSDGAWGQGFYAGGGNWDYRDRAIRVRLVRAGQ